MQADSKILQTQINPILLSRSKSFFKRLELHFSFRYSNFQLVYFFSLTSGQTGRLFVTTLKVSFQLYVPGGGGLSNKLLSDTDIPLSSIESVYELHGENSDKKRKLALGSVLPTNKISGIVIRCKNFKFFKFKFNLQSMKVDGGRNITNAILHYAR